MSLSILRQGEDFLPLMVLVVFGVPVGFAFGDCSVPGGIMEAIAAGAELGRRL
jgi:hypothetical protein